MYQNTQGVQVRDFLEENEARLKGKHFLYVVGTNLEEDTYLRRRSTRGSKDGINVKIGMSEGSTWDKYASGTLNSISQTDIVIVVQPPSIQGR